MCRGAAHGRAWRGWKAQEVNEALRAPDAGVLEKGKLVHSINLPPFDKVAFDFQGPDGGLYALRLKAAWQCDWAAFAAQEANLRTLLNGMPLVEAGQHPFSFEAARARLENRGSSRAAVGLMFTGSVQSEGKLIGQLRAAKTPEGSQLYSIELSWLPGRAS